jgi:DNA (cytosine-5)-methyltransferase 1
VNPDAVRYDEITFMEVVAKDLRVMDLTAITFCKDNNLPILVFDIMEPGNLRRGAGSKPSEQSFPTLKADHGRGMSDQFPHVAHTLRAEGFDASEDGTGRGIPLVPVHRASWAVRRLTPVECARLQGFPDHYLNITYRKKAAADGNKYKALGNSMAVPVMRWIGKRIAS